ncbi:MAG TPA: hypothetical protein PLN81_05410 [Bacillota bacterium]|jgi:hypothetical protein|nr:hypothetical protein [Bacillota bacterium]
MDASLDQLYFDWLYAKVHLKNAPYLSYLDLLRALHDTEFVWLLSGDDNRVADGLDLRDDFALESGLSVDCSWFDYGCSVLEMMVAFSRIANFETDIPASDWFWVFITNLGLGDCHDDIFAKHKVAPILEKFIWRTYEYNGSGGMFPLKDPHDDQRKVEIWYQFCEYLFDENNS